MLCGENSISNILVASNNQTFMQQKFFNIESKMFG